MGAIDILQSTKEERSLDQLYTDALGPWLWIDSVFYAQGARPPEIVILPTLLFPVWSQGAKLFTADTALHSLAGLFVSRVSDLPEVERVIWKVDDNRVSVWTIMDLPNLLAENRIYDAQLELMDLFPEISFDFVIIFRQGKDPEQVTPEGAAQVFIRA